MNYGVNASYRRNGYDDNKIENIGANASGIPVTVAGGGTYLPIQRTAVRCL